MVEDKRKDGIAIGIWAVFNFIVPIMVAIIIGVVLGFVYGPGGEEHIEKYVTLPMLIAFTIMFIIFMIMYFERVKNDFKRLTKKDIGFVFLMFIAVLVANFGISIVLELLNITNANQDGVITMIEDYLVFTSIYVVLIAPFIEELIFRKALDTMINNQKAFILVSGLLFGAMHSLNLSMIVYVVIGVLFALTYLKTNRNLIAATMVHMLMNAVAIIFVILG